MALAFALPLMVAAIRGFFYLNQKKNSCNLEGVTSLITVAKVVVFLLPAKLLDPFFRKNDKVFHFLYKVKNLYRI